MYESSINKCLETWIRGWCNKKITVMNKFFLWKIKLLSLLGKKMKFYLKIAQLALVKCWKFFFWQETAKCLMNFWLAWLGLYLRDAHVWNKRRLCWVFSIFIGNILKFSVYLFVLLIHTFPNAPILSTPWNIRKPYGFLIFSEGGERVHWEEMG